LTTVPSSCGAKKEEKKDNDDGDDAVDEDADGDGDGALAAEEYRVRTVLYDYAVEIPRLKALELVIVTDIKSGAARASLRNLRLA